MGQQLPKILFQYAYAENFSGQRRATELLIEAAEKEGFACQHLRMPSLERDSTLPVKALFTYCVKLLLVWGRALKFLCRKNVNLHVTLGQTLPALIRDGLPILCLSKGRANRSIILSLNGNLFMDWTDRSIQARLFRFYVSHSRFVTVLSARQQSKLTALGIAPEKAVVLPNTADTGVIDKSTLSAKFSRPLSLLHLSNLIESKGYPEFLEALALLAEQETLPCQAVLCGNVVITQYNKLFLNEKDAKSWIDSRILLINQSSNVRAEWIHGAFGAEKQRLYQDSQMFVFTTHYPAEAQPLVLLEAMANGCAIITTQAGEIPSILDEEMAVFVPPENPKALAIAIQSLAAQPERMKLLATAARKRYLDVFSRKAYNEHWEKLLSRMLY